MRIIRGPLRGARWIVGSGTHGSWLGTYEREKQRAMAACIRPGGVAYDIGAHVGLYSLLMARFVGPSGRVISFEPFARNVEFLRRHVDLNGFANVQIINAAVGATAGTTRFSEGGSSFEGRVSETGGVSVDQVCLDDLVLAGKIAAPDYMKIDIEGAEYDALQGASSILTRNRPTIFLATHGYGVEQECLELLRRHGYTVSRVPGFDDEYVARPSAS